jgi:hypothetical protein
VRLTILRPDGGDAVVPEERPVEILVQVDGPVPNRRAADALRLLLRYEPDAPYQERSLEPAAPGRWGTTIAALDVKDGFWYRIAGGDAQTAEFHVRRPPQIKDDFKATYHFRPYVGRADESRTERKIEALQGTEVNVRVLTNREVKAGRIEIVVKEGPPTAAFGERLPTDPHGFTARLTLNESAEYRVAFTSTDGEELVEPRTWPLVAVPDEPPTVVLTQPGKDEIKAADAVLSLAGSAADDVGVAAMRLRMKLENGRELAPTEYRSPKDFELEGGGNLRRVDYRDFVDLATVQPVGEPLFKLRPGMTLEYWLTAEDACDFPAPHVGESKHFKVKIAEPVNNPQDREPQLEKAKQAKKDQDKKQDEEKKKEEKDRKDKNGSGAGDKKDGDGGKPDDKGDPKAGSSGQPKEGSGKDDGDESKTGGDGKPSDSPSPEQQQRDADTKAQAAELQRQLDKQTKGSGKSNPNDESTGEGKNGGSPPPATPSGDSKPKPGDAGKQDAAENKGGDSKPDGAAKGGPDAKQPPASEGKGGDPKGPPGGAPGEGKDDKPATSGEAKDAGGKGDQQASSKEKPAEGASADAGKAEPKGPGERGGSDRKAAEAEAKGQPAPQAEAVGKGGGEQPGDKQPAASPKPAAEKKPETQGKTEGAKTDAAKGENKPDPSAGEKHVAPQKATKRDVEDLAKDLKGKDEKKAADAAGDLDKIQKHADDAEARDQADKELQEAYQNYHEKYVASGKPRDSSEQNASAGKADDKPENVKLSGGKSDDRSKQDGKSETKGDGQPKLTGPKGEYAAGAPKRGPGLSDGEARREALTKESEPSTAKPNKNPGRRESARVLQLLTFKAIVNEAVLEGIGSNMKAFRALEAKLQDLARRETLAGPQYDTQLDSTGTPLTQGKGITSDHNNGGRALPPPGYRGPYEEFNKLIGAPGKGENAPK